MQAASNGNKEIVQLLIAWRADVSARDNEGNTAWKSAIEAEHPEIVPLLKQAGAKE